MPTKKSTAPCGGCGEPVGPVHRCPVCRRHMHPFCGRAVGEEGFGQAIQCPQCDQKNTIETTAPPPSTCTVLDDPDKSSGDEVALVKLVQAPGNVEISDISGSEAEKASDVSTPVSKRHTQAVSSIANRRKVVRWLVAYVRKAGMDDMFAKAVGRFPKIFNSATRASDLAKAMDWWRRRERILRAKRGQVVISARRVGGRRRSSTKVIGGRGRPRSPWVEWLYPLLLEEFDRLRKLGVKFEPPLLLQLAKQILRDSTDRYNARSVDDKGALIIDKITSRWVQSFMEAHQISVAFHLGEVQRGFADGSLDEDAVENIDETHFVVDLDNGKALGFSGEKQIKYADVVSGGEGMTMVVRLSGEASARIFPPMTIFMNAEGKHPIRGVNDDVSGVCYRTSKKGWMTQKLFREYLKEKKAIRADARGRTKTIFLDNCSGHLEANECREELDAINSDLKFFPPNATDLCLPADSFVIAKIKDAWKVKWNEKKMALITNVCWQNTVRKDGSWSGKLQNPGKRFFLELAAEAIREVNHQKDKNGMSYARKAMIRCELSLGLDGTWSEKQLYPHLQEIIEKHRVHFDGQPVQSE